MPCRCRSGACVARETLDIYAPDRGPPRSLQHQARARGARLQGALSAALSRHREGAQARARQPEAVRRQDRGPRCVRRSKKGGIEAQVEGREKHLYSVYRKMRKKGVPLNEIVDVYGFRIVVDSVDTSYRALGAVHGLYKPMPGRFKDYVAIPRDQRLPVAAHDALRPERRAARSADPHRRHAPRGASPASPRTGSTRPARRPAARSRTARASGSIS